jgi:hypothetical protein
VISEREVSRLMPPRTRKPTSQTWRTFLDNPAACADIPEFCVRNIGILKIIKVSCPRTEGRRILR